MADVKKSPGRGARRRYGAGGSSLSRFARRRRGVLDARMASTVPKSVANPYIRRQAFGDRPPVRSRSRHSVDTMEQCEAMSSGRGGDCIRDPSLSGIAGAYAYAPNFSPAQGGRVR